MRKIIISGATGAIGTALTRHLLDRGDEVLILTRQGGRIDRIPRHPRLSVKFCELQELATLENDTGHDFDILYHFAWAGTSGAARNDTALQSDNIRYALDAVALAARFGCHTFIGAGSQAEYGRFEGALTPTTPTFPETGYGIAKLAAGALTRMKATELGMRHVWVRILSVYGPHDRENSLISYTVRGLLRAEPLCFTKAEQHWDLLYSRDAARALALLGERGRHGGVYPLGSGRAKPLREYLTRARDLLAPQVPLYFGALDYPDGQVMHLEADIRRLRADTGFVPSTDFDEGILETAAWWKNQT
jgi:nucleoside-diphosphate-sugar epimerase